MASFDTVGNIIILPENTKNPKKLAEQLLKQHKNIKTVAIKTGNYSGIYRTPKLKILAGKRSKITIYKENNIILK
ncbi:MAG: tRNA (guanine-N1)-methyltransferase, partial [Nanoarchaeota archaeon]